MKIRTLRYYLLFIAVFSFSAIVQGQSKQSPATLKTIVIVDTSFKANLNFLKGIMPAEKLSGDTAVASGSADPVFKSGKKDSLLSYSTARCITDHQGIHTLKNCRSELKNDTLFLEFTDNDPAYPGRMKVTVAANVFESTFYYASPGSSPAKGSFRTRIQQLIIDKPIYRAGDTLSGRVKIIFAEEETLPGRQNESNTYYFVGAFTTVIDSYSLKKD